ncbi:MAG: hypothetical protein P1Q69_00620 [Candidatus Thorarchaeota archaeon]|nr:hypothetical protein [Candidatus Thorarchaeota archaeon]
MSDVKTRNEFTDLNFQIWRVKDNRSDKWRDEVYIIGDDAALRTLGESLQALLILFQTYGKGTKKYKCNPPAGFDHVSFGKENGVQIQWLDMLVVRLGFDAMDNEPFILDDFTVELSVNPATLSHFIERIQTHINSAEQYGHGADAVCGLRFSPDWIGAE